MMCRPSGTCTSPPAAARCDGLPVMSWQSTTTRPPTGRTAPQIALSVEVLPAPLEPSTTATWPSASCRSMPRTACSTPERTSRPVTSSIGELPLSEVGLLHLGPQRGLPRGALGDATAEVHDED